jgi:hypothetical protein
MKKLRNGLGAAAAIAVLSLGPGASAEATTFCIPTPSACPAAAGVAKTDLEEAMNSDAEDGVADTIYLAAGTFTETGSYEPSSGFQDPGSIEPSGTDPLTLIGAGPASVVTSSGSGNIFLMALGNGGNREVTVRDLKVQIPASFSDNGGAALQLSKDDKAEGIEIASLNSESDGIVATGGGNRVRGVEIHGEGAGTVDSGVSTFFGGEAIVEDTDIVGGSWSLYTSGQGSLLTARRVTEVDTRTYGALVSGGTIRIENSVFTIDDGIGLYVSAAADDGLLEADHLTVVNEGSTYPALEGKKFGSDAGDATMLVSNSIFRGFSSGYKTNTPFGPGIGLVKLTARYSNVPSNGVNTGGTTDFSTGNIDADPLFNPDLSLPADSPSVDAGDPGAGLTADFLGAPRPIDGDDDGVAIRDQGAFEYQPPAPPGPGGGGSGGGGRGSDTTPPQTKIAKGPGAKLAQGKARFSFRSSEPGSTFVCKLDKRKTRPCRSPKTYAALKPGRHVLKVWAIDKAGNKDPTPAKKRFRVP